MSTDLSLLIEDTQYGAFKNNAIYTGAVTLSGSTAPGTNTRTFSVALNSTPDITDVVFNGAVDGTGIDPRPANAWFKQGAVWVPGTDVPSGYTNYPTQWVTYGSINGSNLTITCVFVQQFTATLALTPTNLSYRLIDYSVF